MGATDSSLAGHKYDRMMISSLCLFCVTLENCWLRVCILRNLVYFTLVGY